MPENDPNRLEKEPGFPNGGLDDWNDRPRPPARMTFTAGDVVEVLDNTPNLRKEPNYRNMLSDLDRLIAEAKAKREKA